MDTLRISDGALKLTNNDWPIAFPFGTQSVAGFPSNARFGRCSLSNCDVAATSLTIGPLIMLGAGGFVGAEVEVYDGGLGTEEDSGAGVEWNLSPGLKRSGGGVAKGGGTGGGVSVAIGEVSATT